MISLMLIKKFEMLLITNMKLKIQIIKTIIKKLKAQKEK